MNRFYVSGSLAFAIVLSLSAPGCQAAGQAGGGSKLGLALGAVALGTTLAFGGVGKPSGGQPLNKAAPSRDIDDARHGGVSGCVAGNAQQHLDIVKAFEDSMHELVVCGGMSQQFAVSFYDTLINVARGATTNPRGFRHLGGGRYQIGDVMVVSLHLPVATSFGAAGDILAFDAFALESYFVGATVRVKATSGGNADIAIDFSHRGPGAELLGNFVDGNRVKLDFHGLVATLGAIKMRQEISVNDGRGAVRVTYGVVGEPVPIRNLVFANDGGAPLTILGASATNADTGQTLTVTDWEMAFTGGGARTIDGRVRFEVRGGDFEYAGTFVYPHRPTPDIELQCL